MGGQFVAQLGAIVFRIGIHRAQRIPHGTNDARRGPKRIFVGIEPDKL